MAASPASSRRSGQGRSSGDRERRRGARLPGRGLGRYLLRHAERLALELGYSEVRLYTIKQFAANVELYLAVGYRLDREETSALGVTVYMSKSLQGGGTET